MGGQHHERHDRGLYMESFSFDDIEVPDNSFSLKIVRYVVFDLLLAVLLL